MRFLTGADVLDDALSIIRNNSTPVRAKMLRWLNVTAQKLALARAWSFLGNGTALVTPTSNVLRMPADYGELISLQVAGAYYFDRRNRLTGGESLAADSSSSGSTVPRGFTESILVETVDTVTTRTPIITLHGAASTDSVTVTYSIEPAVIADSSTPTSWPVKCQPILMRSLLDFFYEYDMDERTGMSLQLNAAELSVLKAWDNSQKATTQQNSHGYRRTR